MTAFYARKKSIEMYKTCLNSESKRQSCLSPLLVGRFAQMKNEAVKKLWPNIFQQVIS